MRGRRGWAIWITGLPSSGKSTIAHLLVEKLSNMGIKVQVLESDELRRVLTPRPKYTEEERDWFYNVMAWIGWLLVRNGVNVIFDATANRRAYRERARRLIGADRFMEVYVRCPIRVCMERDVKGIYKLALEGKASTVPGLQVPYEEPVKPDVVVDTDRMSPEECADVILRHILKRFYRGASEALGRDEVGGR
ncbi:MAG TPA: adenylyl-sulfate kinase [Candidatus Bathyarchaeota archaeon]|nr:adenylyl-sulfate kinase [Candidatus Bathyarchaeota archaeon]